MKKILYVGNKLDNNKSNISSISLLGGLFEQEGYKLYYASSKENKGLRLLDMIFKTIKYRNNVDYVIIDTYSTLNFYYAFIISQLCRIFDLKYIHRLNGGNLPMRLKKYPTLSKSIFKNAYKLISPSIYLKENFKNYGYKDVIYIPNSIELSNYTFSKRNFNSVRLLWVRSFSEIYNPILAVKILKTLQDDGIDSELCMVGPDSDGSLSKVKEVAEELGITVKFTGKLVKS